MARKKMLTTQLARFDTEGVTVTGILEIKEEQTIQGKVIGRYTFRNDVATFIVNGTVQLDEALSQAEIGDNMEITYTGDRVTSNGFKVRQFEVYVLTEDATDGKK